MENSMMMKNEREEVEMTLRQMRWDFDNFSEVE